MNYKPEPIDTAKVIINTEHLKLTELLAKNTHEIWAQQRIAEGWKFGPQRDDIRKEHPGLVPYEELSESEKQYDRNTALGVIKMLLALGYRIEGEATLLPDEQQEQQLAGMLKNLQESSELNLSSLLAIQRETIKIRPHSPDIYIVLGETILQLGEPLMAYDVITEGLKHWENNIRLKQLLALALARSGAILRANSLLLELVSAGESDRETISILARTHKDLYLRATTPQEKQRQLELAAQRYQQAYQLTGNYYPGINAATMTLLRGDEVTAREIAAQVREQCLQQPEKDYWQLATLGEAALILRGWSEAEKWYKRAIEVGKGRLGDISSTRRNAKLLLEYLEGDTQRLQEWFKLPRAVVFSGHMIDQPGRNIPRFPPELEEQVYRAIRDRLSALDAKIGYASPACGADILFLEAILELNGDIHIVLPYDREEFIKYSVDIIPHSNWKQRCEKLLDKANEVITCSNRKLENSQVLYEYANCVVHGLGKMRAELLDTELIHLAVWDGKAGDGTGGTAWAIKTWQAWGYEVEIIDLESIRKASLINNHSSQDWQPEINIIQEANNNSESREVMALLFADVVKYSNLTEEQIPQYVEYFLGSVAELEAKSSYKPLVKNTWGDALYYVFPSISDAGNFALDLCDLIQQINWLEKGLPENLNLRISLHAGPVYQYVNPVTKDISYIGTHVNYAARIEPITPPGKVYTSQAFAALACTLGVEDFTCDYVGQIPFAKGYGTFPTYHLRRQIID
ncbi:TRAFs-binding domain-containing protein [Nostoc sp. 106C]|uniref:TRAFs-binding domain-containing protein n=1 Tax=Nostoc sp. 106C TaxID=1932667 RepID=UPI000A361E59|nr:TRAFs-binding domain-containing protein [Nostoc sp. 106C]